ncbi:HAD family hydrolase [Saccharopolyspora taberi]|uniref:HAD family hydrolase n=1 Tax=Saccharopolyspora taberi TaxID=60895 RepID=UPI0031E4254E
MFDTVLWRRVPRPSDAFGLLGGRLRRAGSCPPWLSDAAFRRMRVDAEREARSRRGSLGCEVSLFDIWRRMPLTLFGGMELEELVRAEVGLEHALTVVDLDIASIADLARKQSIPVVLVSDTYFTEDQLSHLLTRPELESLEGVRVFRSQAHGVSKADGLWRVVLNELNLRPKQLVHVGDDRRADHKVPSALGIRTVHYRKGDSGFDELLRREQRDTDLLGTFDPLLDPEHGDFGMTSLRAKTLRSGARHGSTPEGAGWRYGAAVLGPVLTGFAEWVARTAHDTGTPVVWCPMREGELLSTLVNETARVRGLAVEAKPLWLSRHVTSMAIVDSADCEALAALIRRGYRLSVREVLDMLRLRPGEVPGLAHMLDTVLDNDHTIDRVCHTLTETPHLRNRLATTVAASRDRLVTALRGCGALDQPELVLVDLGWAGTTQRQLAQALRLAGVDVQVSGLYLATHEGASQVHLAGLRLESYLAQAGQPADVALPAARSPEVLEQSVNATCGSLVDYTADGQPILGPWVDDPGQTAQRRAVRDGVLSFQRMWNRYAENSVQNWPELAGSASRQLGMILAHALRTPTADEAGLFGGWRHEDNFGSSVVTRLLPEDLVAAIPYLSPGDLEELDMRDAFWPRLIAASDTRLSAAARALDTGLVDAAMFEPSIEPCETRLRWRTADGQWCDGPRCPVRINHNGLSHARLLLNEHDVAEVALAIPGRPAIVRVDWIEAKVLPAGRNAPEVLRWDTAEDIASLVMAECIYLGGNVVEFESRHSAVWLPLAARGGGPVSSAQISIGFAMLPRSMSRLEPRIPPVARIGRLTQRARAEYRARGLAGLVAGAGRIISRRLAGVR